jgi:pheromone shutdown protein TraB
VPLRQSLGFLMGLAVRMQAADKTGAQVVLGDRPIEITIERCFDALTMQRRWELGKLLVKGMLAARNDPMDAAAFKQLTEKLKSQAGVDAAMQVLLDTVPELLQPLLHERDLYLAWSMKRSKAVNGTSQVVGVVGKGHLKGAMLQLQFKRM